MKNERDDNNGNGTEREQEKRGIEDVEDKLS